MIINFGGPLLMRDSRANVLTRYKISTKQTGDAEALLTCCVDEIADQLVRAGGDGCYVASLTEKSSKTYTHAIAFRHGVPPEIEELAELLSTVLTLTPVRGIDLAISLDWHKQPGENDDLINTEMGRSIQYTKYATYPNGSSSRREWAKLVSAMSKFVLEHPEYVEAGAITAPPGHLSNGNSYGEKLAKAIARETQIPYLPMTANGERLPQKESSVIPDLTDEFEMEMSVEGTILIIDDVFHTGSTLAGAAAAVRRAGASKVLSLTATRTLSR